MRSPIMIQAISPGNLSYEVDYTYTLRQEFITGAGPDRVFNILDTGDNGLHLEVGLEVLSVEYAEAHNQMLLDINEGPKVTIFDPEEYDWFVGNEREFESFSGFREEFIDPGEPFIVQGNGFRGDFEGITPPEDLSIAVEEIDAGEAGSEIKVTAQVSHLGQADSVTFTLEQDYVLSEPVTLNGKGPGQESVTYTFKDTGDFNPGKVALTISVEEDGHTAEDTKIFGLYVAEADYGWKWADTDHSPFNMIGQVVTKNEGLEDGEYGIGSGFLISPGHIMTNAHVLEGSWEGDLTGLYSVDFFLGRSGETLLADQQDNHFQGDKVYLQKDQWGSFWPDTDMAIVSLDSEIEGLSGQAYFDWFWSALGAGDRDLTGEPVFWAGYPVNAVNQGKDVEGDKLFFQWMTEGQVDGYITGYESYGAESGGLKLSPDMFGAGGASGSPIFLKDDGSYYYGGVFAGSKGADPVATNLDAAAYDWALTIVQKEGYLLDMDFLDSSLAHADLGPGRTLSESYAAAHRFKGAGIDGYHQSDIQVHGIRDIIVDEFYAAT